MILHLDQFAVVCRTGQTQDCTVVNPRMPRHHPVGFSRLK